MTIFEIGSSKDMSSLSYRQEILAEDVEDAPGALWTRMLIESARICDVPPLIRVGVGVDTPGGAGECGIVVAGVAQCSCKGTPERHAFVLQDRSLRDVPDKWAKEVVAALKEVWDRLDGKILQTGKVQWSGSEGKQIQIKVVYGEGDENSGSQAGASTI